MAFLELKGATVGYKERKVQEGLNLTAEAGDLVCLLGRNGAGKSTLLRAMGGVQPLMDGELWVDGVNMAGLSVEKRARVVSMVLTDAISVENLTVRELVAMGRIPYTGWFGRLTKMDEEVVDAVINSVNLHDKMGRSVMELSDGEKQRAVIARALAQDTPVILLDEPTSHLDLPNRIEVMLLLKRLAKETGKCFVVAMHELDVAFQVASVIWLMTSNGVEVGTGVDLFNRGLIEREFASEAARFELRDGSLGFVVKR